jgi:hypothetical protein
VAVTVAVVASSVVFALAAPSVAAEVAGIMRAAVGTVVAVAVVAVKAHQQLHY